MGWVGWVWGWSGWVVAKLKQKKQDDTNGRVWSTYDVYMYPQKANIPLQRLDKRAPTVGAI